MSEIERRITELSHVVNNLQEELNELKNKTPNENVNWKEIPYGTPIVHHQKEDYLEKFNHAVNDVETLRGAICYPEHCRIDYTRELIGFIPWRGGKQPVSDDTWVIVETDTYEWILDYACRFEWQYNEDTYNIQQYGILPESE